MPDEAYNIWEERKNLLNAEFFFNKWINHRFIKTRKIENKEYKIKNKGNRKQKKSTERGYKKRDRRKGYPRKERVFSLGMIDWNMTTC